MRLRSSLLDFINIVFENSYPSNWEKRLLFPISKKGHSILNPKLRGIAISSLLPKIYDIMLNNRLNIWYKPNPQQAGFRPGQGCLIQILAIYLLIELANANNKSIFLGLLDYEKAFDFCNRADLISFLMETMLVKDL